MNADEKTNKMSEEEIIYYKKLGETLRALIKMKGYTQLDFACSVDISYPMLLNHLQGTRRMGAYKLSKICRALEIDNIDIIALTVPDIFVEGKTELYTELFGKLASRDAEAIRKVIELLDEGEI
ncbi:MAG: helix-turn-helix transcriptional regulator [Clostridia bacterium]|nr:helix-turn-helix transcriptional regulator [Clostridia bacterium]